MANISISELFIGYLRSYNSTMSTSSIPAYICPYCHKLLSKEPTRKTVCKHCKEPIYVNKKQNLFSRHLLTKDESEAVYFLDVFGGSAGINKAELIEERSELATKLAIDKSQVLIADVVWSLYNKALGVYARRGDLSQLSAVYFKMAHILSKEGKHSQHLVREANKSTLRYYQSLNVVDFEIESSIGCCAVCKTQNGKILKLNDDTLAHPPLPVEGCTCIPEDGISPICICLTIANSFR